VRTSSTRWVDCIATAATSRSRQSAPGRVLFGPAMTISYFPSCSASLDPEHYNLANLFYEAVGNDPEGKVLVLASNGSTMCLWVVERSSLAFSAMVSQVCSPTGASATSTSWPDMTFGDPYIGWDFRVAAVIATH
jgi:hypothetical protein